VNDAALVGPRSGRRGLGRLPYGLGYLRFRSVALRIGALFVIFALLLITVSFGFSFYLFYNELMASARSAMAARTAEKASAVDRWVDREANALEVLATWPGFADAAVWREQQRQVTEGSTAGGFEARLVTEFRRWHRVTGAPEFGSLMFLHPETGVVEVALPMTDVGKVRRFRPYFREGRVRTFVQNPFFSLHTGEVIMAAASPVTGADGALLGVLAAEIGLAELDAIIRQASGSLVSAQSYIVNAARMFVTQPNGLSDSAVLRRANFTPIVSACLKGGHGTLVAEDHRGVTVVAAYQWLESRGLCLISQADRDEVLSGRKRLLLLLVLTSTAALSIGGILAVFFARTLAAPIIHLARAARRFGQGERQLRIQANSADELGDLAESFNAMAEDLAARDARLQQSNRDLEQFAYIASHDLQEPLRKVTAFGDLLMTEKSGMLDEDGRDYVRYMVDAARRMRTLIQDLLTYSRVTTRGMPKQKVDLNAVLRGVLEDIDLMVRESRAVVVIGVLPTVSADLGQMVQLFQNLITNSIKYRCKTRVPHITIEVEPTEEVAIICVCDNGIGFDPTFSEDIFQPFRRLHGRGEFEGTGMGLAICRRICERHGGRIEVASTPGEGSQFRVHLPLAEAEADRGA